MAYRIEYDSEIKKYEITSAGKTSFPGMVAGALLLFLVLTFSFWPEGWEVLRDAVIPGDDTVTLRALSCMTEDLRQGAALSDAVEAFCREILDAAAYPH